MISPEQFHQHATDRHGSGLHTRVPVVREVLSDLDTPLSVYLKLADAQTLRGWYRNRITRVLLVFLLTNAGSATGLWLTIARFGSRLSG